MAKTPPHKITLTPEESDSLHMLDQARKDAALLFEAAQKTFHAKIAELLNVRGVTDAELNKKKYLLDLKAHPVTITVDDK